MEKLKVILIAVLIWAAIIWFARTMKQKSDERLKKIEERMPEMEPVTEEEREYICENMIDFTTGRNVFLWVLILFNLWMTIVCAWKTVTTGISGEVDSFSSNICYLSIFGGATYGGNLLCRTWLRERKQYETGVLKKKIVKMEKYHYVDSSKIGSIEGRTAGDFLDVSIARNLKKIQADNNMAMLIENEGRDFYLIPRMETEKKYNQEGK